MLKLYSTLAYLWPVLNPLDEYTPEVNRIHELVSPYIKGVERPSLLEFGSGGGRLLNHFTRDFVTHAVDLSPQMIEQSTLLNPSTLHSVGDMRSVKLGMKFDVIIVGDSIGYAISEQDLKAVILNCRQHLKKTGVLLLLPDWTQETYTHSHVWRREMEFDQSTVSLVEYQYQNLTDPSQIQSVFVFLITNGTDTIVEVDYHSFGLHSVVTWRSSIESAHLSLDTAYFIDHESGLSKQAFVCSIPETEQTIE